MNRKDRRAARKRSRAAPAASARAAAPAVAAAFRHYELRDFAQAEDVSRQILAHDPAQPDALNLLALIS